MSLLAQFDSQALSRVGAASASSSRGRRGPYRDLPCRRTALSVNLPLQPATHTLFLWPTRPSNMSLDPTAFAFPPPQFDSSPLVALHLQQRVDLPGLFSTGDSSDVARSISTPSSASSSFTTTSRIKSSDSGTARSPYSDLGRRESDLSSDKPSSSNSASILPSTKMAMEMGAETEILRCKNVGVILLPLPNNDR